MATKTRVSLKEYLALEECKPYRELIDGEVVEKAMPRRSRSRVVTYLIALIYQYLERTGEGDVDTELRHLESATDWVFLPDVSVTRRGRRPPPAADKGPVEVLPDFAIEVLSPDDRPGRTAQRIAYYMRAGVTLLWVIDPEGEQVTVWERGAEPRVAGPSGLLSAAPVLPGFAVDLDALFTRVRDS